MNLFISDGCIIVKRNVIKCIPFTIDVAGVSCLNCMCASVHVFSFRGWCKARSAYSSSNNQNRNEMNLFVTDGCIIVKRNVLKCTPFTLYALVNKSSSLKHHFTFCFEFLRKLQMNDMIAFKMNRFSPN